MSLLNLATKQQVADYLGTSVSIIETKYFNLAQETLNAIIPFHNVGAFSRFIINSVEYKTASFTSNYAIIPNAVLTSGLFAKTVLTGLKTGHRFYITNSEQVESSYWLYYSSTADVPPNQPIAITQEAFVPFMKDCNTIESTIYKIFPEWLVMVVALQYEFEKRIGESGDKMEISKRNEIEVDRTNFKIGIDTSATGYKDTQDKLDPTVYELLSNKGILAQTLQA